MSSKPRTAPSGGDRHLLHGVDWAVQAGVADEVMLGTRRRVRQRRQKRVIVTGVLAALVIAGAVWFAPRTERAVQEPGSSGTVAMPARQVLPDGTQVELKDGAEIAVAYSPATRRVVLQRGEAHFEVMPNKARPFVVAVGAVEVRAVGTAFSVQRRPADVEVMVTHGRVAVDRVAEKHPTEPPGEPRTIATLDAGHQARVDVAPTAPPPVVKEISPEEMQQRLAWRAPRLEFTRTPLNEAIAMINQHSAIKVSLADPSLGTVRISGMLHVDNVESLLRLLEIEHGIKAEHTSASEVVLRSGR